MEQCSILNFYYRPNCQDYAMTYDCEMFSDLGRLSLSGKAVGFRDENTCSDPQRVWVGSEDIPLFSEPTQTLCGSLQVFSSLKPTAFPDSDNLPRI